MKAIRTLKEINERIEDLEKGIFLTKEKKDITNIKKDLLYWKECKKIVEYGTTNECIIKIDYENEKKLETLKFRKEVYKRLIKKI